MEMGPATLLEKWPCLSATKERILEHIVAGVGASAVEISCRLQIPADLTEILLAELVAEGRLITR